MAGLACHSLSQSFAEREADSPAPEGGIICLFCLRVLPCLAEHWHSARCHSWLLRAALPYRETGFYISPSVCVPHRRLLKGAYCCVWVRAALLPNLLSHFSATVLPHDRAPHLIVVATIRQCPWLQPPAFIA